MANTKHILKKSWSFKGLKFWPIQKTRWETTQAIGTPALSFMPVNEITTKLGPARLKFRHVPSGWFDHRNRTQTGRFGFGSKWGKILLKNWDYGWFDHEKIINWIGTNRDSSKMGWSGLQSKPIFWTPVHPQTIKQSKLRPMKPVHTLCPELRTPCSARCFPLPSVSEVENRWIIRTRNCQTLVTWTSTTILPWIP